MNTLEQEELNLRFLERLLFHDLLLKVSARGADDNITVLTALEFNVSRPSIDVIHALKSVLSEDQVSMETSVLEATDKIGHVLPSLRRWPSSFLEPPTKWSTS